MKSNTYPLNLKDRKKLKRRLHDSCIHLCNCLREDNILILKGVKKKKNKHGKAVGVQEIWDLPTCACCCFARDILAEGYSHRMQKCHHILESRISQFGEIGYIATNGVLAQNHEPWPLGQCAEQHAANRLLYESHEKPTSKGKGRRKEVSFCDIYVGPAYRVKTRQFMPACKNCRAIFSTATIL